MSAKIENLEQNVVKVDITIDAKTAEKAYNNAVSRMAKQVNIPSSEKEKLLKMLLKNTLALKELKFRLLKIYSRWNLQKRLMKINSTLQFNLQ